MIYVGGGDCPPCTRWKTTQKPRWLASPEFPKVAWVEVESPKLKDAYQERYWPGRVSGRCLPNCRSKAVTPRFLIVSDGKVVSNEFGSGRWAERPWPISGNFWENERWRAPSTAWWSST